MLNNLVNKKKKPQKSAKLKFFIKNNVVSLQYDRFKKNGFQKKNSHTLRAYEPLLLFLKKT